MEKILIFSSVFSILTVIFLIAVLVFLIIDTSPKEDPSYTTTSTPPRPDIHHHHHKISTMKPPTTPTRVHRHRAFTPTRSSPPSPSILPRPGPPTDLDLEHFYAGDFTDDDQEALNKVQCSGTNQAPVFRFGAFYDKHNVGCSHPAYKRNIIYQCCDKGLFEKTLKDNNIGSNEFIYSYPDPEDPIFSFCSPPKTYTISNMGGATRGKNCDPDTSITNTGCGNRNVCSNKVGSMLHSSNKRFFDL